MTNAKKKLPVPLKKPLPKPAAKVSSPASSLKKPSGQLATKGSAVKSAPKPTVVAKPIAAPARPAMPVRPVATAAIAATKPKESDKIVGIGHNGGPASVSKTVLKSVVDRIENLEEDKQGIADDIKEVYTEAKAKGLDVKTIRKIVAARRRDKEKLRAEKELMDIYLMALDPELAEVLS